MSLDDLRHVEVATVWKAGRLAADLRRDTEGVTFEYAADYAGEAVAITLPRDAGPVRYTGGALPPFFSGLLPVAIAGVQDKVSGRMIALPVAHAGAAWILKLDPPEFPHLVANEAFFLAAARSSGLDVAEAEIVRDRTGSLGWAAIPPTSIA
jgi:HipA-like protein